MIYINGEFYKKEDAKISVYDHGLLYGDGIFEGIRIYNGKIFKLKEHVKRLFESAKGLYLDIGKTLEEMEHIIKKTVDLNKKDNGYIRVVVTRGVGNLGVDPVSCKNASVIVIVDDISLYPKEYYKKGIEIMTSSYRRISVDCFDVRIKSLNYLNNVLAKMEARRNNCFESVILNKDGYVTECTGDNIFIIKDGVLKTPETFAGALGGITRDFVLEISRKLNIETKETYLTKFDLITSDECFLTGTGAEVIPVVKIDGTKVGDGVPGDMTLKIINEFKLGQV
jgi:branched-chain amino acid aminotransferase